MTWNMWLEGFSFFSFFLFWLCLFTDSCSLTETQSRATIIGLAEAQRVCITLIKPPPQKMKKNKNWPANICKPKPDGGTRSRKLSSSNWACSCDLLAVSPHPSGFCGSVSLFSLQKYRHLSNYRLSFFKIPRDDLDRRLSRNTCTNSNHPFSCTLLWLFTYLL